LLFIWYFVFVNTGIFFNEGVAAAFTLSVLYLGFTAVSKRIQSNVFNGGNLNKIIVLIMAAIFLCAPAYSISNAYIDARVAAVTLYDDTLESHNHLRNIKGRFTIGNGEGRPLLYGFPTAPWSSITTIKIDYPNGGTAAFGYGGEYVSGPSDSPGNTVNTTVWKISNIQVTQVLSLVDNPRGSGLPDTVEIKYVIENLNAVNASVGLRVMLDVRLGTEAAGDNSPIFVQGMGRILKETQWTGAAVPEAWQTVDRYDNPLIKAEGGLSTGSATKPDRFLVGQWSSMSANPWLYTLNTTDDIADIAAAMYWESSVYAPGEKKTFITYYGLPYVSGANIDMYKSVDPAEAFHGDTLSYNISYSNTGGAAASSVYIWDTLPWNTSFVDASPGYSLSGRVISWSIGALSALSSQFSLWFRARINPEEGIIVENEAASGYTDAYWLDY